MRTPADDAQVQRHNFGQMAENLRFLHEALIAEGFTGDLHDKLVLAWWNTSIASALQPNMAELLAAFLPKEED